MSIDSKKCPQCGTTLGKDAPAGLCPRCVMALNFQTQTNLTREPAERKTPPTPEELAPSFPQLEILECLGRGGMGVVYKARQPQLDRVVALKILAPERVTDARFADRFLREARALARLNQPNIVTVHDFGQADGYFYLLMEFVDGVNLREILRRGRMAPAEALAIVPPICQALQYAHDRGIIHRDIKPENILLDREGKVKIADFGIARIMTDPPQEKAAAGTGGAAGLTAEGALGTPNYMAPEQAEKPGEADHRADIYSLGVVFYEMLTGELPGDALQPPSKKVHIDVRLDEIVLRALEQKPELRFQQASALRTQVETVATGAMNVSSKQPAPEALMWFAAFLTIAVAALFAAWFSHEQTTASLPLMKRINVLPLLGASGSQYFQNAWSGMVHVRRWVLLPMAVAGLLAAAYYARSAWAVWTQGRAKWGWAILGGAAAASLVGGTLAVAFVPYRMASMQRPALYTQSRMPEGDSLEITTNERNGDVLTVRGRYELTGQPAGELTLYTTTPTQKATPVEPSQRLKVGRGHGIFSLTRWHLEDGTPHVSLRADGKILVNLYLPGRPVSNADTTFSPPVEKTLTLGGNGYSDLLDLDSGKTQPANLGEGGGVQPVLPAGIMVVSPVHRWPAVLLGSGTVIAPLPGARGEELWKGDSGLADAESLSSAWMEPGQITTAVASGKLGDEDFPQSFLFKCSSGKVGLLQITGFTEHPAAVRVRYKWAQGKIAAKTALQFHWLPNNSTNVQAIIHVRNFSTFPPSLNYDADVPQGYKLEATDGQKSVNTIGFNLPRPVGFAARGNFHSDWIGASLPPRARPISFPPFSNGIPATASRPIAPPSFEVMQARRVALQKQMQALLDAGPIPVVLGHPTLLFTTTNAAEEVYQGFFQLVRDPDEKQKD